jgi:hypothetical protein
MRFRLDGYIFSTYFKWVKLKKNPLFLSPQPFIKKCGKVN